MRPSPFGASTQVKKRWPSGASQYRIDPGQIATIVPMRKFYGTEIKSSASSSLGRQFL
jgi:hypothetical protein